MSTTRIMATRKIRLSLTIACASIFVALTPSLVFGDGWIGNGGNLAPSGGGGGGGAGCATDTGNPQIDCNGLSWIYYKWIGTNKEDAKDFKFPDSTSTPDNKLPEISYKCAEYGDSGRETGFWHYGRNARARIDANGHKAYGDGGVRTQGLSSSPYTWNTSWNPDNISNPPATVYGGTWGHFDTWSMGSVPSWANGNQTRSFGGTDLMAGSNPDQILYHKGKPVYKAVRYSKLTTKADGGNTTTSVYQAFKKAYKYVTGDDWTERYIDGNVYAFCYGERMSGGKYTGEVKAYANGSRSNDINNPVIVTSDTFTLSFDHNIKRNDSAFNGISNNTFSISNNPIENVNSATETFSANQLKNVRRQSRVMQSPMEGATQAYCSTLKYNDDFDENGNGIGEDTKFDCVYVKRSGGSTNNGSFQASHYCSATANGENKGEGCNKTFYTNSRNWTIYHAARAINNAGTYDVQASYGDTSGVAAPYNHGFRAYGLGSPCVRSHTPFTKWWFTAEGSNSWGSGLTLSQTSELDLASPYGANDYQVKVKDAWWENNPWIADGSGQNYSSMGDCQSRSTVGNCHSVDNWTYHPDEYETRYHYAGCGAGTTYWQTFNWGHLGDGSDKTWNEYQSTKDDSLLLGDKDSVSIRRNSLTVVDNGYWANTADDPNTNVGRAKDPAYTEITRERRYIYFSGNTSAIKADTGIRAVASTPRETNNFTLDTSGSNGEFTITFTYAINRDGTTHVHDSGAEHYPVTNSWRSRETIEAIDGSNQTYRQNGNYGVYHDYGSFSSNRANTTNVAGQKTETVSGRLYYGQTVKVCGNLNYGRVVRETDDGSEIWETREDGVGCINVTRKEASCSNVVGSGSEGYNFSHQYGHNVAKIGVTNTSLMNSVNYTSWNKDQARTDTVAYTNTDIWARPGDNIRYYVEYCMGASYAYAVHQANGIYDGGKDTTLQMSGDSKAADSSPASTNKLNANQRSNYLFGDTVSTYDSNNKRTTPITFNFIKRNDEGVINEAESTKESTVINSKKSPENVGTIYSCPQAGGNTNGTNEHYQVAGKVKHAPNTDYASDNYIIDGCTSNRTQSLDVGRQMSENLQWTNMYFSGKVDQATVRADYLSSAHVNVPYNYTAKPYVKVNSRPEGTVQIGGKMTVTPGIAVFPRKNCALIDGVNMPNCSSKNNPNAIYATVTKPTTVTLKAYINNESHTFQSNSYVVRSNTKSNLKGSSGFAQDTRLDAGGTQLDNDYVVDVPNNVNPGDKICVKMTITPADSHNHTTKPEVYGASQNATGAERTSEEDKVFWALREDGTTTETVVSCSTAVKRPTMSNEDSNLYSASQIATGVVARNTLLYNGSVRSAGNTDYYLYGSWSEYGIFGSVKTGSDSGKDISTLGTASGAALGYDQSNYLQYHHTNVIGYNAQPLVVVTYNGGPKNGTYEYNYYRINKPDKQLRIEYNYATKDDGTHYYQLISKTSQTIQPSAYNFANTPIVNDASNTGVAKKGTTVCAFSTQTFANTNCDNGVVGSNKIGADAVNVFTTNILDRYGDVKMPYTKTDSAPKINSGSTSYTDITGTSAVAEKLEGDEEAAMFKNIKGKAFLGYSNGQALDFDSLAVMSNGSVEDTNIDLTAKSVMVYKADTIVINSNILANNGEKTGAGDFRMPIIIANKVWFTGTPTRIDAIIIAKEELNTCKWNDYNSFVNNITVQWPDSEGSNNGTAGMINSDTCANELRFTAPVVVKGKLILNRTYGGGGGNNGGDKIRRAEIFELNAATYLWSYAEMSRYSQAITTYSRELPSRY